MTEPGGRWGVLPVRMRTWLLGAGVALGLAAAVALRSGMAGHALGGPSTAARPPARAAVALRTRTPTLSAALAAPLSGAPLPSGTGTRGAAALAGPPVRRVEESAAVTLSVRSVTTAFNALGDLATGLGGYVQSSTLETGSASLPAAATLVAAVPQARYAEFLQQAGSLGRVLRSSASGQDVTQQYVDLQGRLSALETERSSYLALLGRASSIGDILQIQSALTAVQAQIEDLTGQIHTLDALSAMATVTVDLQAVVAPAPPPPQRPTPARRVSAALRASLQALAAGATAGVLALAYALPWLMLGTAGWLILRRLRRRGAGAGSA